MYYIRLLFKLYSTILVVNYYHLFRHYVQIVAKTHSDLGDYSYYFVSAPWLSVKLMKILECYPVPGKAIHIYMYMYNYMYVRVLTLSILLATYLYMYTCVVHVYYKCKCPYYYTEDPIIKARLNEAIETILNKASVSILITTSLFIH